MVLLQFGSELTYYYQRQLSVPSAVCCACAVVFASSVVETSMRYTLFIIFLNLNYNNATSADSGCPLPYVIDLTSLFYDSKELPVESVSSDNAMRIT
jgi:hypothetical protein